ncbi:hypothetical protein V2J09_001934 [Rumex salicifolius]
MDFDDAGGSSGGAPKPLKFVPKSRFQPKARPKPVNPSFAASVQTKPESSNGGGSAVAVKEEQESDQPKDDIEMDASGSILSSLNQNGEKSEIADGVDLMDVECNTLFKGDEPPETVQDDFVVREINVYFKPSSTDDGSKLCNLRVSNSRKPSSCSVALQLFVLQYPLRPSWRPYELGKECKIRVMPTSADVEIDLPVDMDSENFDREASNAERFDKLTLSSKWRPGQRSAYAIGVFTGSELHLNPVFTVRQLRPSMENLNPSAPKKKSVSEVAIKASSSKAESSRNSNKVMDQKENELCIPLEFHDSSSHLSARYRAKMFAANKSLLQFPIKPLDYLDSLCPQAAIDKTKPVGQSKRMSILTDVLMKFKEIYIAYNVILTVGGEVAHEDLLEGASDKKTKSLTELDYNEILPYPTLSQDNYTELPLMLQIPCHQLIHHQVLGQLLSLLLLPLDQRLKSLFTEGASIHKFSAIKHYALDHTEEDILRVVEQFALLVQGNWVAKTAIRHPKADGSKSFLRDYALCRFSQGTTIKYSHMEWIKNIKKVWKDAFSDVAFERPKCEDWKFKEPTDILFIKQHPEIVEKYEKKWKAMEEQLQETVGRKKNPTKPNASGKINPALASNQGTVNSPSAASIGRRTMPNEAREALPIALRKLFQAHKVCSFQTICQGLRSMALNISAHPKGDASVLKAAAFGLTAPQEELLEVISEVVVNIHGAYVMKLSLEHPELNPLRNVVIGLFIGKGPNAKVKKSEIIEAAKMQLQKEPSNDEFRKVVSEFCESSGSAWVLKSGDGKPELSGSGGSTSAK